MSFLKNNWLEAPKAVSSADQAVLAIVFGLIVVEVFQGPIRYYLYGLGLPWMVYAPKFTVALALLGLVLHSIYRLRISRSMGATLSLTAFYFGIGVYYTSSVMQPMFGLFAIVPLLLGIFAEPALARFGVRITAYVAVLWGFAAFGVAYDYFRDFPWSAFTYQIGSAEIEGNRGWTTFGVERISGFARASFEAADQLLLFALALVLLVRRKIGAGLIWALTGALIIATTSKKTAGAYALLTVLLLIVGSGAIPRSSKALVAIGTPMVVGLVGVWLPVSTLLFQYTLDLDDMLSKFLFASFQDRLTNTWPEGFALVFDYGSAVVGRGIGGIGAAQSQFEKALYSPADNMFLYLYATFGTGAVVGAWFYLKHTARIRISSPGWPRLMWFLAVAALLLGWANNAIESPVTALALGLTVSYVFRASLVGEGSPFRWQPYRDRASAYARGASSAQAWRSRPRTYS